MSKDDGQLHYAPRSVGALMDTVFLRQAVHDADSQLTYPSEPMLPEPSSRWRVAMKSVVGACLRRLHR